MMDFAPLLKIQTGKHPSVLFYVKSQECQAFLELFIPIHLHSKGIADTVPKQKNCKWKSSDSASV